MKCGGCRLDSTIEYYNKNAKKYFDNTFSVCMTDLYYEFEKHLFSGANILDLGCGSGRDSKYFLSRGYNVVPMDASVEICRLAEAYIGTKVINLRIENMEYCNEFDAIWASASLLHIEKSKLKIVLSGIINALREGGILYASWKYGDQESLSDGRYYVDINDEIVFELFKNLPVEIKNMWITKDNMYRDNKWINMIVKKKGIET